MIDFTESNTLFLENNFSRTGSLSKNYETDPCD